MGSKWGNGDIILMKKDLKVIIESSTIWDPETSLLWCSKSLRKILDELVKKGYIVSYSTTWIELKNMWYSLQWNRKTQEWWKHKDRDEQFKFKWGRTWHIQSKRLYLRHDLSKIYDRIHRVVLNRRTMFELFRGNKMGLKMS